MSKSKFLKISLSFVFISALFFNYSCSQMKETEEVKTKDIVFTTDLVNDPEMIQKYIHYHSPEGIWPEVIQADEAAGFTSVKIYFQGNRLIMILTVPEDADMDEMNRRYAASSEKIKEWGEIMSEFQVPPPGADSGQVWVPMKLIHEYNAD